MKSENSFAKPVLEYISFSRISSYLACSLVFAFRYVHKIKPAFVPGARAFGIAFHKAMEEALIRMMAGSVPPAGDLIKVFEKSLDELEEEAPIRWSEKDSRETVLAQARAMLEVWLAWKRPEAKILAVEEELEIELAPWLPKLVGRADLVEEGDVLTLVDLKSSRNRWGEEQVIQGTDQLVLYREGLRSLIGSIGKPVRLGWEVITKQKSPVVERHCLENAPINADRPIKTATLVLEAIEQGVFVPSPGWTCLSCPFRGPCREWVASNHLGRESPGPSSFPT